MNASRILLVGLVLITVGLCVNQWRLQRAIELLTVKLSATPEPADDSPDPQGNRHDVERRLDHARIENAEARLAAANTQIAQLDLRLRQVESGRPRRGFIDHSALVPDTVAPVLEGGVTNTMKRAWGPEQVAGPPDTMQAGDISTAWASREQDGGEEWLKMEYERAVDIAEVRVRETYNPGAISKVTAFLANGTELTLWEGTEPPSQAPVEMSFSVPASVSAKSIKVYLDTARVPGWNEIDAVAIVGRDGSIQWAHHVTASSTYAQPRLTPRLTEF